LAQAPLFGGLETAERQAVLAIAHYRRVEQGAFFFHQDEPATTFYVLLEGHARLSQLTPEGQQVIVHVVKPGEGMGIIVALGSIPYPVSAEAVTDCLALGWEAANIVQLMERYPRLAVNGMRLIAGRFVELQDRYRELATERVERRIARVLLRLVRQLGRRTDEGILIDIPLSRQDLAEMTGTTLYTVSRILSHWEQQGLVITGRERVTLCKSHELVVIAEDLPNVKRET
jgi:CRP-like cAMP-binding protein